MINYSSDPIKNKLLQKLNQVVGAHFEIQELEYTRLSDEQIKELEQLDNKQLKNLIKKIESKCEALIEQLRIELKKKKKLNKIKGY